MIRAGLIDWRVGSWRIISATSSELGVGSWVVNVELPCPMSLEVGSEVPCSVSSDTSTISGGVGDAGSGGVEGTGAIRSGAVGAGVEGEGDDDIIIAT